MTCYGCNVVLPHGEKVLRRPVHNGQNNLVAEPHCAICAKDWDERDRKAAVIVLALVALGAYAAYRWWPW